MKAAKLVKEHSSIILTSGAGVGTILTAYLSARASFEACRIIDIMEERDGCPDSNEDRIRNRFWLTWRLYVPAGMSAFGTILCVAGSKRVDGRKALAAQAGLALCQRAYSEYRDEIVSEFGHRKDEAILAKVAEKRVAENPPGAIVAGSGTVLCCELYTMRYFNSDMQTLNKIVNEVNKKLLMHDYATLDDLYYELGIEATEVSGHTGWESPRLLELEFSTVLHNGVPCLAFGYNYIHVF